MTGVKDHITGVLNSSNNLSTNQSKRLFLSAFATILLVSVYIAIVVVQHVGLTSNCDPESVIVVVRVNSQSSNADKSTSQYITELYFSTITSHLEANTKVMKTQKSAIELAVDMTRKAIQQRCSNIEKLITKRKGLTTGTLKDCLKMVSKTLDELTDVTKGLKEYHTKKSLKQHAEYLKRLMSLAITDQNNCLYGFSHYYADKKVHKELEKSEEIAEKLCSNALAMICNMTSNDIADESTLMESNFSDWPKWLSAGYRKLLQSGTVVTSSRSVKVGSTTFESSAIGLHPKFSPRSSKYSRRAMPKSTGLNKVKG